MTTLIVRTVAKAAMPIILLTSFAFMLQGHNLPGGGFIAGILTTISLGLMYIVFGVDYVEENILSNSISMPPDQMIRVRDLLPAGLGIGIATGLAGMFLGVPFLTHGHQKIHLALYGSLHPASAVAFDLGVYLVVVGSTLTVISEVGKE